MSYHRDDWDMNKDGGGAWQPISNAEPKRSWLVRLILKIFGRWL